jgi:hypothetical protein
MQKNQGMQDFFSDRKAVKQAKAVQKRLKSTDFKRMFYILRGGANETENHPAQDLVPGGSKELNLFQI